MDLISTFIENPNQIEKRNTLCNNFTMLKVIKAFNTISKTYVNSITTSEFITNFSYNYLNTKIAFASFNYYLKFVIMYTTTFRKKFISILFFIFSSILSYSQNCNVKLNVEKNRDTRSTPSTGTFYKMTITNLGNSIDTYVISTQNINSRCNNANGRIQDLSNKSILEAKSLDLNQIENNRLTVNPGQTLNFLVKITVPQGTAINSWCCTEVVAQSTNCSNVKSSIGLYTLVINSSEE